jgi:hypothetical protein
VKTRTTVKVRPTVWPLKDACSILVVSPFVCTSQLFSRWSFRHFRLLIPSSCGLCWNILFPCHCRGGSVYLYQSLPTHNTNNETK